MRLMKTLTKTGLTLILLLAFTINLSAQEIFDAVRNGDLAKVKELVEKDPQLVKEKKYPTRSTNGSPSTLLHVAGELDNVEIAKYLIEKGADVNALDGLSLTPIMYSEINVAKLLIEKGADINFISPNWSTLTLLFFLGKKETADYLIDKGIKLPDLETDEGKNTLSVALRIGSIKYLDKCVKLGLTPFYESEAKNTLLHLAAVGNSIELINKLITLGTPLNNTNIYGWTALHNAAYNGNKDIVELFIKKGLNKNIRTTDGSSPYNLAVEAKKTDVVEYLISIGADQSPQKFPDLKGEYLGHPKPGKKAVPFAPGIVAAKHNYHGSLTFSPNGTEAYWSVQEENSLFTSKRVNGRWTIPDTATSIANGDVPFISPDGNKFYFMGVMKVQGREKEAIYVREKTPMGWSEPYLLPDIINSVRGIHWQVSVDGKGNLYFGAGQNNKNHIYRSELENGTYHDPVMLEYLKNVEAFSPYIAPDGSYLIISKRSSGLSILFKKKDGTWLKGSDLTSIVGTHTICPIVTHDGKYLFFLKDVDSKNIPFWVDASFIEDLRKEALKDDR